MNYILSSSESYEFEVPREIEVVKSIFLEGKEAWLVKVTPHIIGQKYGLMEKNISHLLLSPKHIEVKLSDIKEFPCFVYIARLLNNNIPQKSNVYSDEVEIIAWGEINPIKG